MKQNNPHDSLNTANRNSPLFWFAVILPFVATYFLYYFHPIFLNNLNQMQFPIFVPKFDPIGCDLQWLWDTEKNWVESGFSYPSPEKGSGYFPPAILLIFIWCSKLSFQTTYNIFSVATLTLYLATAIVIPYLVSKKSNLDKNIFLISVPFALLGLNAYGFQFEIERGQWNLFACCLAIWGVFLYWYGGRFSKGFAIALLTVAIQLKLYPGIYILALFACRKNLKDGVVTLATIAVINLGLLFIFGLEGFSTFTSSVTSVAEHTSYGVAQTSISAFLWLISKNYNNYLPLVKILLVIYWIIVFFTIYHLISRYPVQQEEFIGLVLLLTIIGLIVPPHSNDYKLSIMPLVLSILSPQLIYFSNQRARYGKIIPIVILMFFCGFSTYYSYATKSGNMFIQNNVANLLVLSILQCALIVFIIRAGSPIERIRKFVVLLGAIVVLGTVGIVVYQVRNSPPLVIEFSGAISPDQMKKISLDVKVTEVNHQSLKANVIVTNNSSINFNTVNTSGFPVRLSWRFIKVSPSGTRLLESTWDARKDLAWTIVPGESGQVEVSTDLPKASGDYLFEVTIVQDLVQFFHDAGMRVASVKVNVDAEK